MEELQLMNFYHGMLTIKKISDRLFLAGFSDIGINFRTDARKQTKIGGNNYHAHTAGSDGSSQLTFWPILIIFAHRAKIMAFTYRFSLVSTHRYAQKECNSRVYFCAKIDENLLEKGINFVRIRENQRISKFSAKRQILIFGRASTLVSRQLKFEPHKFGNSK